MFRYLILSLLMIAAKHLIDNGYDVHNPTSFMGSLIGVWATGVFMFELFYRAGSSTKKPPLPPGAEAG